jgi:hypothetical protein
MDYQKIYDNIVRRGQNRILEGYKEKHHIVPRCLGGTDDADNLVSLTPEEHYLCHLLLVKIYPKNIRLVRAAMFMISSNSNVQRNNKAYGWLKRQYSEYMRGPNNPQKINPVRGDRHYAFGKSLSPDHFSKEGKKVLADKMLGDKNPCARVKPWCHPRATDFTRSLWKRADEIYNIWTSNNNPSYCKLCGLTMNKKYNWKEDGELAGPFMNMVKYFRNGWVPEQDEEWKEFKNKQRELA